MAAIFVWLATLIDVDSCSLKLKVVVLEHSLDQKNRAVGIRHLNPPLQTISSSESRQVGFTTQQN